MKTVTELLNKYAKDEYGVLGFWYEDSDLEGLTDYEIIRKCVFLDQRHGNSIINIFGFDTFEQFVDDYTEVANALRIDLVKLIKEVTK